MTQEQLSRIELTNNMVLFRNILLKYKVMIARHKMSFMASYQGMTVKEMIFKQILKTNKALKMDRIVQYDPKQDKNVEIFLKSIQNVEVSLFKAVEPLQNQSKAETIFKKKDSIKDLQEKFQRSHLERKRQTVEQIFGTFKAIAGDTLFQADNEQVERKKIKEKH